MEIQKINAAGITADKVASVFKENRIEYNSVENVNWPSDYPYKPDFKFAIAHDGKNVFIHYKVSEKTSRAAADRDCGRVWEDSCVEFFFAPDENGYYNFECTCIGKLLIAYGAGRHERQQAPKESLESVQRWASIGSEPFEEKPCGPWEVALIIPVSALFRHEIHDLDSLEARANFYKCGDLLSTSHFISWAPIKTETPDFHRPEFFAEIKFAD